MRFQDAVKDARSVVYAGIQADPLVARAAGLLADATPAQRVLARAVMNGESTDAGAWQIMFPTLVRGRCRMLPQPPGRLRSWTHPWRSPSGESRCAASSGVRSWRS